MVWDMTEGLPLILSDTTNSYIYGPDGLPVEQISSGGTVTYLHHDQQGSTRLLTGSTGTVTGKCTYSAYGTPTCEGTTTTPLGYDGQYTSSDTGFIYLRARVYDPSTAQFLIVDPLVGSTGAPYNYADDNPLNDADPSGRESISEELSGGSGICFWPGCGSGGASEAIKQVGEESKATINSASENLNGEEYGEEGNGREEQAEATQERKAAEECEENERGKQLRREGEDILGHGHNPARRQPWNEWWKQLGKAAKKAYDKAEGPSGSSVKFVGYASRTLPV